MGALRRWLNNQHCPHIAVEAVHEPDYRLICMDCGRLLRGPSYLARLRADEQVQLHAHAEHWHTPKGA
jgi:hypothetical protein